MRNITVVALVFTFFVLTACDRDSVVTPDELPFNTHPSVLREDWAGTIFNTSESENATLELSGVTPNCADSPEEALPDRCSRYAFTGRASVNGSEPVPLVGEGDASAFIYTLTTPPPYYPEIYGEFTLDGALWRFDLSYLPEYENLSEEDKPAYKGSLSCLGESCDEFISSLHLEPANP